MSKLGLNMETVPHRPVRTGLWFQNLLISSHRPSEKVGDDEAAGRRRCQVFVQTEDSQQKDKLLHPKPEEEEDVLAPTHPLLLFFLRSAFLILFIGLQLPHIHPSLPHSVHFTLSSPLFVQELHAPQHDKAV